MIVVCLLLVVSGRVSPLCVTVTGSGRVPWFDVDLFRGLRWYELGFVRFVLASTGVA